MCQLTARSQMGYPHHSLSKTQDGKSESQWSRKIETEPCLLDKAGPPRS